MRAPLQGNTTEASTAYDVALWDALYIDMPKAEVVQCAQEGQEELGLVRTEGKCNSA